jgi:PhnB protein
MARTSTYLNFAHHTEEAFNFYKTVFNTEFTAPGIRRMGDIPPQEGTPVMSDELKNLVMHVELPITGGHILMGTDAPKQMGFTVTFGNNVHINLEPDSRDEATKLFNGLSTGGKITMELQDMFWGALFGSCTDKFGVHWTVNCMEKAYI